MPARESLEKMLFWALLLFFTGFLASWWLKGAFPKAADILPELRQEPIQQPTSRKEFSFLYKGERYRVKPVAEYEMWGLAVDHNDIHAFWDIYHTSDSVDILDLGVIWGKNVETDDFHRVKMWSSSWCINWQYPAGVKFSPHHIANNHFISDDERTRKQILKVRKGDQVHFKGMLVNYQAMSQPDFWRKSSLTRTDTGGTACEVVFVESIEVLKAATPVWYFLYELFFWAFLLSLAARIILLFYV